MFCHSQLNPTVFHSQIGEQFYFLRQASFVLAFQFLKMTWAALCLNFFLREAAYFIFTIKKVLLGELYFFPLVTATCWSDFQLPVSKFVTLAFLRLINWVLHRNSFFPVSGHSFVNSISVISATYLPPQIALFWHFAVSAIEISITQPFVSSN